ncbi:MAG: hypothetical protein AB7R89_19525 [Dehalococcoidia bacterium]
MRAGEPHIQQSPPVQRCTIRTSSGRYVSAGIAVLIARSAGTEACVTELTEPGTLLMAFVGRGIRRFNISLEDGRELESDLIGTAWHSSGRRLCRFALTTPVAAAS